MVLAERFLLLFGGNTRSYGQYPLTGKPQTKHQEATIKQVEDHFSGKMGLGMVPLGLDSMTSWGVIDIDCHGDEEAEFNTYEFADKVQASDLPLLTCRSKSGGIHLYLFLSEPMPAKNMRVCLKTCASLFGYPSAEIFPKQNEITEGAYGNWINLPYFNADNKTNRFCAHDGVPLSLEQFLDMAESIAVRPSEILELVEESFNGAPPCICHILENGVTYGNRNTALFNVAVFYKQSEPKDWRECVMDFNAKHMSPPLSSKEVKQTLNAVSRKDYFYKCNEEPCKSHCNRSLCRNREFGMTAEQQMQNRVGESIEFKKLSKINTDPPQWDLDTAIGMIRLTTDQLLNPQLAQKAIAEKYLKIIPPMKNIEWLAIINSLMEKADIIHAPDDASPGGLMFLALKEYLSTVKDLELSIVDREKQWRAGMPVIVEAHVWFKGSKFQEWLKRTRKSDIKEPAKIFLLLRDRGVESAYVKIAGKCFRGWRTKKDIILGEEIPELDMREEF